MDNYSFCSVFVDKGGKESFQEVEDDEMITLMMMTMGTRKWV